MNTGADLLGQLRSGVYGRRSPSEVFELGRRWVERSLLWANDPNGPLAAEEREAFQPVPTTGSPVDRSPIEAAIEANLHALRAVRDKVER